MSKEQNEIENYITTTLREIVSLKNNIDELENEKKDQFKKLILGIIDVIDSFERAEEGLIEKQLRKTDEVFKTMQRYKLVLKKLQNLLSIHGVTKLEFPENKLIIGFSKVIDTEPDSNKKNDEIISIVKNGYIKGKELIRDAEIIIVKN